MPHDVFLSHSASDKPVADALCRALERAGVRCWMAPRDILPGQSWGGATLEAIGSSRVMVIVFSRASNTSPQVLREVERAVSKGITVLPFRIQEVTPSGDLEYFLSTPHWMDALTPPLDAHVQRLVTVCKRLLDSRPAAASVASERRAKVSASSSATSINSPLQSPSASERFRSRQVRWLTAGVVAVLFAAVAVLLLLSRPDEGQPDRSIAVLPFDSSVATAVVNNSVAVLPFDNLSSDPENAFFSDGITDEILTTLSRLRSLHVISRTSVMGYKNTTKNVREIGEELKVANVLEGTVRRAGNRVRITVQLINAGTDRHLWAETYDRELKDIFAIQTEIAQRIADAMSVQLSSEEQARFSVGQTNNLTAYDYYLKGKEYLDRVLYVTGGRKQELDLAITFLRQALQIDSLYARAHAQLARAYYHKPRYESAGAWDDSSAAHARRSVSLDPNLAEGHVALGLTYAAEGNSSAAYDEYLKASTLSPSDSEPIYFLQGIVRWRDGRFDEALRLAKKAVALDPRRAVNYTSVGAAYQLLGDAVKAERWYQEALKVQPDAVSVHVQLVQLYALGGDLNKAASEANQIASLMPDDAFGLVLGGAIELLRGNRDLAHRLYEQARRNSPSQSWAWAIPLASLYMETGQRAQAESLLQEAEKHLKVAEVAQEYYLPYLEQASFEAVRGNKERAIHWLLQAEKRHWPAYYDWGRIKPTLKSLHSDPRFQQILIRSKARSDSMRLRVEREGW